MLSGAADLMKDSAETKKEGARVRRKSKELEDQLAGMQEASDQWNALAAGGGRRSRRGSRDYSDDVLKEAFEKMDLDKSGTIEQAELENAIRAMDPNISQAKCTEMMNFADADGDG